MAIFIFSKDQIQLQLYSEKFALRFSSEGKLDHWTFCSGWDHNLTLKKFGQDLQKFPSSPSDVVIYEPLIAEDSLCSYIRLKAYVYNSLGHSALEFWARNFKKNLPEQYELRFNLQTEPASLNAFGKEIETWVDSKSSELQFELFTQQVLF